jgi:hypothetical protein
VLTGPTERIVERAGYGQVSTSPAVEISDISYLLDVHTAILQWDIEITPKDNSVYEASCESDRR